MNSQISYPKDPRIDQARREMYAAVQRLQAARARLRATQLAAQATLAQVRTVRP